MRRFLRRLFLSRLVPLASGTLALLTRGRGQSSGQAAIGISGFDHVAVPMENTERMVQFYRTLGMRVQEGERICSVHFGDHKINFHRPGLWQDKDFTLRAPAALPPCGDFCFVWEGTEAALAETLALAQAEIVVGPVPRRGGA